jgi:hypothetical protein
MRIVIFYVSNFLCNEDSEWLAGHEEFIIFIYLVKVILLRLPIFYLTKQFNKEKLNKLQKSKDIKR